MEAMRSAAIQAQLKVRQEQQELDDFIADLVRWEAAAKKRDAEILAHPKPPPEVRPVREKIVFSDNPPAERHPAAQKQQTEQQQSQPAAPPQPPQQTTTPKKPRISSWDYASWDRFDADAAAEAVDADTSGTDASKTVTEQRKQKAETERDAGNDLFRKGKFFQAAECYTRAMEFDPSNAMFPANRAMCYLRLDKPNQAESDATRAVELDPSYAKGFYRRAMARKELQKYQLALDDLNRVLELEPGSKQAQDEKEKVVRLLAPAQATLEPRVTMVDAPPAAAVIEPTSSKPSKTSSVLIEQLPEPTPTVQKPTPSTLQPAAMPQATTPLVSIPLKPELPTTPPTTFFEFNNAWASLETSPELRAKLLAMIPSASLGSLFKGSANPSLLGAIIQTLAAHTLHTDPAAVASTLQGLTAVGRFDMLVLCLAASDKRLLKDMFDGPLQSVAPENLRSKWKI